MKNKRILLVQVLSFVGAAAFIWNLNNEWNVLKELRSCSGTHDVQQKASSATVAVTGDESIPSTDDSTLESNTKDEPVEVLVDETVQEVQEVQDVAESVDLEQEGTQDEDEDVPVADEKSSIPIAEASNVYMFPDKTELDQISTFDELKDRVTLHNDLPIPRNLNIAFMGDSLTRYLYLDLVHFLKVGRWIDNADRPNFVLEKTHANWTAFYNFTNTMLRPYEQCDCYRKSHTPVRILEAANVMENRYFRDGMEGYNNTVTYIQKFGNDYMRSNWNASDIYTPHENYGVITNDTDYHPAFTLKTWVDVIEEFVCKMEPKPSVLIFNSGLWWRNNDLVDVTLQGEIVKALKKCDILSMYKTTTRKYNQEDRTMQEYEEQLCNQTDYCWDLTWTGIVPKELYFDMFHVIPPVYSYKNVQLLSMLSSIAAHEATPHSFRPIEPTSSA